MKLSHCGGALGIVTLLASLSANQSVDLAQAGGAWNQEVSAPTIRQRDWRYESDPLQPRVLPAIEEAQVTRVYWRHDYVPFNSSLKVWLCAASICTDASAGKGMTEAFSGMAAETAFKFYFQMPGQGMLSKPLQGKKLHVIVNYD